MTELRADFTRQHQAIRREYQQQAPRWGKLEISDHLRWVVDHLPLRPDSAVVDVAAGTGLFGRAVAPHVGSVTGLDITPEMIEQGRARATQDGIGNMEWQQGMAETMPFSDGRFDLAITRYSFHHFVDPAAVLKEMGRVCNADGTVVVVDMVSDEDPAVAARHDALETVIDTTHTHILSPSQLVRAAADGGLQVQAYLSREVEMNFDRWQAHVPVDAPDRLTIRRALEAELAGGERTGMRPYMQDGVLCFMHVWGVLLAGKRHRGMHDGRMLPRA